MRNKYALIWMILLYGTTAFSQMELRNFNSQQVFLLDINDSGQGVKNSGTYDFATNTFTPMDVEVTVLQGINNNGDLLGKMPLIFNGQPISQPGYKHNGVWHPMGLFPGATTATLAYPEQLSENGIYATGYMGPASLQYGFLYDTNSASLTQISNPSFLSTRGNCVNNNGIVGGFVYTQANLNAPQAAYFSAANTITLVPLPAGPANLSSQVFAINNNNVMVGYERDQPFIYDLNSDTFTSFPLPSGYTSGGFTGISDNGIAVGYYGRFYDFGEYESQAILYAPAFGSEPVFLKDILAANGIVPAFSALLGWANAISPDGNYICGHNNGSDGGWAVNLNNLLLDTCFMNAPTGYQADIATGIVTYNLPVFHCNSHPDAALQLVSGYAPGSVFPAGTTTVTYNLVDTAGTVLSSCSFDVTLVCTPGAVASVSPITSVSLNGWSNESPNVSTEGYESFWTPLNMIDFSENYLRVSGNTNGNNTSYITVFVDWNNDGLFSNADERNEIGTITNSNGTDGIEAVGNLSVPMGSTLGNAIKMRVIKSADGFIADACSGISAGQVEDYYVTLLSLLSNPVAKKDQFQYFPNPTSNQLHFSNTQTIDSVEVYNLYGQLLLQQHVQALSGQIDVSGLPAAAYLVKAISGNQSKVMKIIKQ